MKAPSNVFDINTARVSKGKKAINDDGDFSSQLSPAPSDQAGNQEAREQNTFVVFVRHFLVMLLMWLRGPLRLVLNIVSVPAMIALPIVAFGVHDFDKKTAVLCGLAALSFGSFCIKWLYDTAVMKLSPDPLFLS